MQFRNNAHRFAVCATMFLSMAEPNMVADFLFS